MNYTIRLFCFSLLAVLSACVTSAGVSAKGIDGSDDELLATLASLAKRGTEAICNPAVLEKELGLKIGELEIKSPGPAGGDPLLHQQARDVRPSNDTGQIKEAGYKRVKSPLTSHCHIYIQFKEERICRWWVPQVARVMGVPLTLGPVPPHGPQRSAVLFVYKMGEQETVVGLGDNGQLCANGFGISSEGEWK